MFIQHFKDATPQADGQSDLRHLFAYDPGRSQYLLQFTTLTSDEIYLAAMVIALFNFYNAFVDLHGVDELSAEGYTASGARLSTAGYTPPPRPDDR